MLLLKSNLLDNDNIVIKEEELLTLKDIKEYVSYRDSGEYSKESVLEYKANILARVLLSKVDHNVNSMGLNLKNVINSLYNNPDYHKYLIDVSKVMLFWTMDIEEYEESDRNMLTSMRDIVIEMNSSNCNVITISDKHMYPREYSIEELMNMPYKTVLIRDCVNKLLSTESGQRLLSVFHFS